MKYPFDEMYQQTLPPGFMDREKRRAEWYTNRGMRVPERDSEYEFHPAEREWFDARGGLEYPTNVFNLLHRWDLPIGVHGAIMSLPECVRVKCLRLGYWGKAK